MPQIKQTEDQKRTATSVQENKLFRQRLEDRFKPHEFVRVRNLDDEPFEWEWMPSTAETVSYTDNGAVRVVEGRKSFSADYSALYPGNEQHWVINPGQSEVLLGENAYLFIEGMYKKLVTKQKLAGVDVTEAGRKPINFNWNDGLNQEKMIDKILIGVERPNFDEPKPATAKKA